MKRERVIGTLLQYWSDGQPVVEYAERGDGVLFMRYYQWSRIEQKPTPREWQLAPQDTRWVNGEQQSGKVVYLPSYAVEASPNTVNWVPHYSIAATYA